MASVAYYTFVFVTITFALVQCYSQYSFDSQKYCDDLSPHIGNLSLDQISGVWYGVEKIPHFKGEYKIEHTQECFYIDIREHFVEPPPPTPYPHLTNSPYVNNRQYSMQVQHRIRHFVLEWHEGLWQDDYHIKVNTSRNGFWITDVPSKSVDPQYRFFGGVIQVLKVANNHLVLNFCMRLPNSQLFSVVLSRNENQLYPGELADIHNVFTMKHLSTSALKRVCENSATNITISTLLVLATLLFCGARL